MPKGRSTFRMALWTDLDSTRSGLSQCLGTLYLTYSEPSKFT